MSRRILRVNQLIKKELSQIILREIETPRDILITITRVETSPDLRTSKVYISSFPEEKLTKIIEILEKRIYNLQQKINQRLKMRPLPKLEFVKEKKTVEAGRIEEVLEELKKEEK